MKITKVGHSCFLIQEHEARILLDPGSYSQGLEYVFDLDAILITHEHSDHFDPNLLDEILRNNPRATIHTNSGVGKILEEKGIAYLRVRTGESFEVKGVMIQTVGEKHALIHQLIPIIENTGFLIGGRFFYPGDALTEFPVSVEILAAPITAPWMRVAEGIEYIQKIKPKIFLPAHDGMLKDPGFLHKLYQTIFTDSASCYQPMEQGIEIEI